MVPPAAESQETAKKGNRRNRMEQVYKDIGTYGTAQMGKIDVAEWVKKRGKAAKTAAKTKIQMKLHMQLER